MDPNYSASDESESHLPNKKWKTIEFPPSENVIMNEQHSCAPTFVVNLPSTEADLMIVHENQ